MYVFTQMEMITTPLESYIDILYLCLQPFILVKNQNVCPFGLLQRPRKCDDCGTDVSEPRAARHRDGNFPPRCKNPG